nr:hypothetical protein [Tanacetum cinerariifolium]
EPIKKCKRVKRAAKKSTTAPTSVVIRDTSDVSVSKKKAPAKADRNKVKVMMIRLTVMMMVILIPMIIKGLIQMMMMRILPLL